MAKVWKVPSNKAKSSPTSKPTEPWFSLFKRVNGQWVRCRDKQYNAKTAVNIWYSILKSNSGYTIDMVKLERDKVNTRSNKHHGRVTLKPIDKVIYNNLAKTQEAEFRVGKAKPILSTDIPAHLR